MTTIELLMRLRRLNVTLAPDNGQIVLSGPKGALTESLRAELNERRAEILELLKNVALATPLGSGPRPVGREKEIPLSFAQQRLWFLDQFEPGSAVYNVSGALRIRGPLNAGILQQSIEEIVRRHEALRTTFSVAEGRPVQTIAPSRHFSLPKVDISHVSESEREEKFQRLASEEFKRPFDLRQGPLFRATLIRLDEDDHALLLTLHHIVSDGWSLGVLYRELSVLYHAFTNGEPSPLRDLPIQYADYAAWQRAWLQGEVLESQLSYWKKQLDGVPAVLNLPTDRQRPPVQSFRGSRESVELSSEVTEGLKTLSRKRGVSLYMTLLAAFQALLHRYTGQDDVVVGSPIANRNRLEIEGLIGFFVNTLVLRTNYSGNPTFNELLDRARETALAAYEHQDLPFEKLVEELRPARNLGHSPLFQAMFVFQNTPARELNLAGLAVSPVRIAGETTKFDLTLTITEGPTGLRAILQYSTDLFDESTMTRMLGHFQVLLEGIVTDPDQRISELTILTQPEKHQLLVEWNETKISYPTETCLHELFEAQVERTPEAMAVSFEGQRLTYQELNTKANQLAHYLQKLGVGADVLVGISLERSLEMVIALMAVLKAGGAYLPLDSSYPAARMRYMLRSSGAAVLLTLRELAQRLPPFEGRIVCLDQDRQKISIESAQNPLVKVAAGSLAYVIYTSGSTGSPKGVMISHGAICNHMMWMHEKFSLDKEDRVAQRTSFSFDASVWEFFAPLISGAQLVLAQSEASRDPACLVHFLQKERITILQLVPTLLQMLLDQGMTQCTSLRRVFCGGEPLSADLCARFRNQLAAPIINLYGPTETTIDATAYACSEGDSPGWAPIGRPIANTQVYVLDRYLGLVPVGVVGEICIGGEGLARGYLNQPELTAEKFIANPFSSDPASRLYLTGDLGRYLPDGNIEILGRVDEQVKVRGYRIELGEIETILRSHPAIRQCAVAAREDTPGDKRLIGYVVTQPEGLTKVDDLRSFLKQHLPDYMVPSVWVGLDQLPLLPNGKVDRGKLPLPDQNRSELEEFYQAPRTPTEVTLAKIWAEVLKIEKVGVRDNFFELGGHSLLATQVISRVGSHLSVELPIRALFESPTVAELAAVIEKIQVKNSDAPAFAQTLCEVEAMTEEEAEDLLET